MAQEYKLRLQQLIHLDGRSINLLICLSGRNKIKVRDKETNKEEEITLDELEKKCKNFC